MTVKRIATAVGIFVGLIAIISLIASVSTWKTGADTSHQMTDRQEQRTLPEINAALDKITKKLTAEEIKRAQTIKYCKAGVIKDRALCRTVDVFLPEAK